MEKQVLQNLPPEHVPTLGPLIADSLATVEPNEAQAVLGGLLGNIVGHIPDEMWKEMHRLSAKPCDQPGCTCHVYHQQVYDALDALRKEWERVMREKTDNPDEKGFAE